MASAISARFKCAISLPETNNPVATEFPLITSKVSGPTNRSAARVMTTCTWAPSAFKRRHKETAL